MQLVVPVTRLWRARGLQSFKEVQQVLAPESEVRRRGAARKKYRMDCESASVGIRVYLVVNIWLGLGNSGVF